jgi:membrane protease YdiL (CAAX protease family)
MPWDIWLIFLVLGVVVPWRGRVRLRELLAKPYVGTAERISLYASTIAFQWLAAGVAGWRAWAHGFSAAQLGLTVHDRLTIAVVAVAGAGAIAVLQWLNLRRLGRTGRKPPELLQALAKRVLPQSTMEMLPFFALAVTAGLCEEFLYRGFAVAAFSRAGLPAWGVILVSSGLFGLAHLYQGRGGLLGTMILGALFGVVRITYDSLVPVVLWHIAVDVVAGVAGPRYLAHATVSAVESET